MVMPAAMMFIPSIGGVSHDFSEDTALDDIVLGAQVFTDATARILAAAWATGQSAVGQLRSAPTAT